MYPTRPIVPAGLAALALGTLFAPHAACAAEKEPLNVLLITADDLNFSSVGFRGSAVPDITPNLDRLASQGMVFEQAHVNVAVSQPSRAVLATGMYSHRNGVEGFFQVDRAWPTLMSELRAMGYRVGIAGKVTHSTPVRGFAWDCAVDQPELGQGRDPQRYYEVFRQFVREAREAGRPFYFMANSHDPHRPFHGSPAERSMKPTGDEYPDPSRVYTPDEVEVPGFLPDLPAVRLELSQYFSSVRRLDDTVGAILRVLDEEGVADRTLVVFLSDNGMSAPFAKTNCYMNSTRTPWIVRWPGVVRPGTRDGRHLIAGIDLMPTVLEACGGAVPATVDGRSFVPLLRGGEQAGRDRVFTQFYETSGRRRYPMFTVQSADYLYIFNPWSDGAYKFLNDSQGGIAFKGMVEAARSDEAIAQRVDLLWYRVPEEFYDLRDDPSALHNRIDDAAYAERIAAFREELAAWMAHYGSSALEAFEHRGDEAVRARYMEAQRALTPGKHRTARAGK